jgi:predicted Rossmann-fold nucleotide-binding protein
MPKFPCPFEPIRESLYTPDELFAGFDPAVPRSYAKTRDFAIYRSYVATGKYRAHDFFASMMQSLHDNSILQAVDDYLSAATVKAVAMMGGHGMSRDTEGYREVALLSRALAREGFTMLSGGGPGAMEATHLGALLRHAPDDQLNAALALLARTPHLPKEAGKIFDDAGVPDPHIVDQVQAWFAAAWEIVHAVEQRGESLAIPTWLYGHEPSTPFATHIAKYFQNSIREDGLVSVATHGIVFSVGSAGTLQEIFQDATQNYYRTFGTFSPMVFLGGDYWTKKLPAVPTLQALLKPEDFQKYVLVSEDLPEIVAFLSSFSRETPAQRMEQYLDTPHQTGTR